MIFRFLFAVLLLVVSAPCRAAYVGPGDIKPGAVWWHSCSYGYSAAYATGSNNGCKLFRTSDSTTQDIKILATGLIDTASALTFCTDATATATVNGTTLTVAAVLTGTIAVGDQLTGTGINADTYIVSGSSSPYTITNSTGTSQPSTGSITVTMTDCRVDKAYDQSGALACAGSTACDAPVHSARPYFSFNCLNGTVPCMSNRNDNSGLALWSTANGPSMSQPFTFSVVFNSTTAVGLGDMLAEGNGKASVVNSPTPLAAELFCGTGKVNMPILVGTWYMWEAGANSPNGVNYLNQSPSLLDCGSTGITAGTISIFSDGNNFLGQIAEDGAWNAGFTLDESYSISLNQATRYGLPFSTTSPPSNPACITGVTQPTLAAAAGLNCLSFYDNFVSTGTIDLPGTGKHGYNWYPQNFFMNFQVSGFNYSGTPHNDYAVASNTLTVSDTPGAGMGLNTAGPTHVSSPTAYGGRVFVPPFYIKFKVADDFSIAPGAQREGECGVGGSILNRYYGGGLFMQDVNLFFAQTTHTSLPGLFGEIDLLEFALTNDCLGGTVTPLANVHYWTDWNGYNSGCTNVINPAGPWDGVTFHTEEAVVNPSSGVNFYHDGSLIVSCSWSPGSTLANAITNSPMALVVGPGLAWPIKIQDVEVWQQGSPVVGGGGGRILIR